MSPFFLYYIIVAVWEYPFFLSSPIHNSAAVKAKAANWDALRCFATFTLRNRKFFSSKTSLETRRDETRRDEMFWDEFYGPASGQILVKYLIENQVDSYNHFFGTQTGNMNFTLNDVIIINFTHLGPGKGDDDTIARVGQGNRFCPRIV